MGSKGGFALLGILFILTVLCHTGYSLECYNCVAVGGKCNRTAPCTHPLNSCLYVKAASRNYYMCWEMANCNFHTINQKLGEPQLEYMCCEKDLCNRNGAVTFLGESVLLLIPLLAVAWNLSI